MSTTTLGATGAERIPGLGRAVAAAAVGNMLEWYDFSVYAYFAAYIAQSFFPDDGGGLLKALLAFGVGFVIRPVGAVVIGAYGDRAGRKASLMLTILVMALGTLIIAVTPGYAQIGIAAPVLLLVGRLLQGFSAGGEIGGAAAFLVEHAPPERRGFFGACLQASMGMSNVLAALIGFSITNLLSAEQLAAWGWRIPFLVGLLIAPVGLILRRTLQETPQFQAELERRRSEGRAAAPLATVFRHHGRALLIGLGFAILWGAGVYVLNIYSPTYVQKAFGFRASQAFAASLVGFPLFVAGTLLFGRFSDTIGRKRMMMIGAGALLVSVLPLYLWLDAVRTTATLIAVQSSLCILMSSFVGSAPSALSELFPTGVRSTGMSLVYNTAFTLFGGFAPAILTWANQRWANAAALAPAGYVMAAAALALATLPLLGSQERMGRMEDRPE